MEPAESFKMSRCKVKNYYNQHLRRHQQNIQIQQQQHRSMFLPIMLCARSSVKDVNFSTNHNRRHQISPSSPVGCVFQTAKRNNKVVSVGSNPSPKSLPSSATVKKSLKNTTTDGNGITTTVKKKHKLKKLFFFSKSVSSNTTSSSETENIPPAVMEKSRNGYEIGSRRKESDKRCDNNGSSIERKCRIRTKCGVGSRGVCRFGITVRDSKPIDIANLDPPLPVVKKQQPQTAAGVEIESLWKRRSGGATLRCLQVKPIDVAGGDGGGRVDVDDNLN